MGFEDRKTWHFFWSIAMFCNFVLCFFFWGGGGYPLKWFLRLEIFDPENDWGKDSKPQIWTCFFESDGWFDCKVLTQQCWPEFLDVPNVHKGNHIFCCFGGFGKCLGYINVIVAIDLSIPHSKPTHQKQSEPYIGYTQLTQPFLPKITLNIFFVGGVRTEIHLPTPFWNKPRSFLDQRKGGEPNDGDDGSGHAAAAFAPLPGRTARRPSVGRRISQRRSTETQDGQTPRWMRCEG